MSRQQADEDSPAGEMIRRVRANAKVKRKMQSYFMPPRTEAQQEGVVKRAESTRAHALLVKNGLAMLRQMGYLALDNQHEHDNWRNDHVVRGPGRWKQRGVADIVANVEGVWVELEAKAGGADLDKTQIEHANHLIQRTPPDGNPRIRGVHREIRSLDDVRSAVDAVRADVARHDEAWKTYTRSRCL